MSNISDLGILGYFPKQRQGEELYNFFSILFKQGLKSYCDNIYNSNKSIYDPSSDDYNPDYILSILLGNDIAKLLLEQPYNTRKSLSLLYSQLINLRGTEQGIDTFLRLTNIHYVKIVYLRQKNGCSRATIVIEPGVILDDVTEKLLVKIARRLFPFCVTLAGVTNCDDKDNDEDYDVGQHLLSINFRLNVSKLSMSQGEIDDNGLIINNCELEDK